MLCSCAGSFPAPAKISKYILYYIIIFVMVIIYYLFIIYYLLFILFIYYLIVVCFKRRCVGEDGCHRWQACTAVEALIT